MDRSLAEEADAGTLDRAKGGGSGLDVSAGSEAPTGGPDKGNVETGAD
jgi:hypothetical protein